MSFLDSLLNPLERLITEHGSSTILREHLGLLKAKLAEREAEHNNLQTQHEQLKASLLQAQARARELEANLQAMTSGQHMGLCCDACGSARIRRIGSRPNPTFGEVGVKDALFLCDACGAQTAQMIDP